MPINYNGSYSQNFDSLASSGTLKTWQNDNTLPGWFLFRQPTSAPVAVTTYNADTGTSNSGSFYSFGEAPGNDLYGEPLANDRAFGGSASGGAYFGSPASGGIAGWIALALKNTSGNAINKLNISFNGEQWRDGGNTTAQSMVLEYGYGNSFDQVTTWTTPAGNFNWSSPIYTATAAAVNGNTTGRVSAKGGELNLTSPWAVDSNLWFRWIENNDAGNDHGLAVDDLSISSSASTPAPTYIITPSTTTINEGAVLASTVTTTNIATGTKLYYALNGTGITAADFSAGALTGEGITDATGKFSFSHTIANDQTTEGTESLAIKLYSDSARTLQVGTTATVSIADTSTKDSTTYVITALNGKYRINGEDRDAVTLNLSEGNVYIFDQSNASNANHPLKFSVTSNGTHGGGQEYTKGVITSGTPGTSGAFTKLTLEAGAPTLYYFCQTHSGMGGQINTTDGYTYTLTPSTTSIIEGGTHTSLVTLVNTNQAEQLSGGVERSYLRDLSGVSTKAGDTISVRYTGKLNNGTVFDSNNDGVKPESSFKLGAGEVIKGWDTGLLGVNVGDVLILNIPADQAYGNTARGQIPANSALNFQIEVLGRSNASGSERFTASPKIYYSLSGNNITASDFSAGTLTGEGAIDATGKFTFSHTLANDQITEGVESLTIKIFSDKERLVQVGTTATVSISDPSTPNLAATISAIQGNGAISPLVEKNVELRAVVVGDFQLSSELGGFYLQEETSDWDTNSLTSEGIYVVYPLSGTNTDVVIGDRVLLTGTVGERFNQTAITAVSNLKVEAQGKLTDTKRTDIPELLNQRNSANDLEPYEGMWVRFPEKLTVNGLYGQFRYGEVELSAGGLPQQPTNVMNPGSAAYAAELATAKLELILDDGSNSSYRPASAATPAAPVRDQLLRRGDSITAVEGIISYDFSKYRLQPTAQVSFKAENPRPAAPAAVATGLIRLASFNVLNTFTTLNTTGAVVGNTGLAPRGANTAQELERQFAKLTVALDGLKSDVIGLMELENDSDATLKTIVDRLNAAQAIGSNRNYSYIPTGVIGTDAIKVGLIYNNKAVTPVANGKAVLDALSFTDPLSSGVPKNRPALAQAFTETATGEVLNVVVNHLKSKGAGGDTGLDVDQKDGQAAFNATRTTAAKKLLDWIATKPTGNADADWVILGDINAYAKEDPIKAFEAAGYRNALPTFTTEPPSSYAFYNPIDMSGALDHMMISGSLVKQAISADDWSINSSEGAFRDYNSDNNSNGSATIRDFYTADPYRTSDHDPVMLDLDLGRGLPIGLKFGHGIASGDPYATSVILWTRITPPQGFAGLIDVQWEISTNASFSGSSIIKSSTFSTSAARDWTVKVEADGLKADTNYFYRFRSGDVVSQIGNTKTLPVGLDPVRLAVFSCANFTAAEQFLAYGRAVVEHDKNPYDALVHLGDYIYEYGAGGYSSAESSAKTRGFEPNREIVSLEDYRQRYAQYHTDSNLQKLRSSAPLIAIWDDHETANDSWSGGADNHQKETEGEWQTRRDAALKAYHEWLPIREPGLRQASDGATALSPLTQGYRSFNFGDVLSLHILETRLTARDEQLEYPDAAAVQARIGAIVSDQTLTATYATRYKLTAPKSAAEVPTFGSSLAQPVTQELVFAAVQKALGDPDRDLIGDTQLAWLQTQLATSKAPWQVLGQQVLMQSMSVPAELLLDAGNPALLDKYAAPLQKLATGTTFAQLTDSEKALFSEATKIPYNLDAWDGYGVERETILQSALALGKKLISLAGDTHNAWAGVLDTFTAAGNKPAGTVAGVEFATPGVTSPGLEKYLPGGDAYIRAKYPAVDGLDGIFTGYVSGLKYADLNRRGYLDLTVSPNSAIGAFVLSDGADIVESTKWITETIVASADLSLNQNKTPRQISWSENWKELDLIYGLATDLSGKQFLLDPANYAISPRAGIQLADALVTGSKESDRIYAGTGSRIDAAYGNDELYNTDSIGNNLLIGGNGIDSFYLGHAQDIAIGGSLLTNPEKSNVLATTALKDSILDKFYIDSSLFTQGKPLLTIADFNIGTDQIFVDGVAQTSEWSVLKNKLIFSGVSANAAPHIDSSINNFKFKITPGFKDEYSLSSFYNDQDNDPLKLVAIDVPTWISTSGNTLIINAPVSIKEEDLNNLSINLGTYDGKVVAPFTAKLSLTATAIRNMEYTNSTGAKSTETFRTASGSIDTAPELKRSEISPLFTKKPANSNLEIGKTSVNFNIKPSVGLTTASISMNFAPMIDGMDIKNKKMAYFSTTSPTDGSAPVATTFTYDPIKKAGAKFYDLDKDKIAETIILKFIDGGYGDKDNAKNGVIVDPSAAGAVTLLPVFSSTGSVLTIADPIDKISPAAVILNTSITSRANTVNQIGYVAFNQDETSTTITYDILKDRANTLFANLESSGVPSLVNINFNKDISVINGQKLVFFEVVDTTLEKLMAEATNIAGFGDSFRTLNLTGNTTTSSATNGGNTLRVNLADSTLAIGDLISAESQESPILDFTSLSGISLSGTVTVAREANYNSIVGFYKIENASGAVRDSITNLLIQPGDAGYQAAALRANNLFSSFGSLSAANGTNSTANLAKFSDAGMLAPYANVTSTGETFFAFGKANSDGLNHFRALGSNTYGLEDLKGGGDLDCDDLVVSFDFTKPIA